jgi:hypothetical protein
MVRTVGAFPPPLFVRGATWRNFAILIALAAVMTVSPAPAPEQKQHQ